MDSNNPTATLDNQRARVKGAGMWGQEGGAKVYPLAGD